MPKKVPRDLGNFVDEIVEEDEPVYAQKIAKPTEPVRPKPEKKKRPRRLALAEPERTDLPRQTFYMPTLLMRRLKVYAAIDNRGISEIVREAVEAWLNEREQLGFQFEDDES